MLFRAKFLNLPDKIFVYHKVLETGLPSISPAVSSLAQFLIAFRSSVTCDPAPEDAHRDNDAAVNYELSTLSIEQHTVP